MNNLCFNVSVTPSLNKLKGFWACMNYKKKYLKELRGYDTCYKLENKVKAKVSITRNGKKLLDKDNLYGGCKPLIDAIKELHLIVDDKTQWLDLQVEQTDKNKLPITNVVIEYEKYDKEGYYK